MWFAVQRLVKNVNPYNPDLVDRINADDIIKKCVKNHPMIKKFKETSTKKCSVCSSDLTDYYWFCECGVECNQCLIERFTHHKTSENTCLH